MSCESAPFMRTVRCRTVANTLSIGFDVRRCVQCSAGKSKNVSSVSRSFSRQSTAFSIFRRIFLGEGRDRRLGRRAARRQPDLAQVPVGVRSERTSAACRGRSTSCAPSSADGGSSGTPRREPSRSRARHRRRRSPARPTRPRALQIDEQLLPALRALAHAGLKADQLLLALRRRADQHQHAFGLRLHARLQIDAVGPHIHIAPRRQIALVCQRL